MLRKRIIPILLLGSILSAHADIVPIQNEKGKWGFQDEESQFMVAQYKYDEAHHFVNDLALVKKGNSYGMISPDGKEVFAIKYDIIEPYNDSIYKVAVGGKHKDGVIIDEKYGFINKSGMVLLKPEYEEIGVFTDNLAYIKKGEKYGYINNRIEVVVPCKYIAVGKFTNHGFVWVCEGGKYNNGELLGGKFGIYNKDGKIIIPVKYKSIGSFAPYSYTPTDAWLEKATFNLRTVTLESGNHFLLRKQKIESKLFSELEDDTPGFYVSTESDGKKNGVYSLDGNQIIKEGKYEHAFFPTDNMMLVSDKKGDYNFINIITGQQLFQKSISDAWGFDNGVAIINRNGDEEELIDINGNSISSRYTEIFPKKEGVHIVRIDDFYGVIDSCGNVITLPNRPFIYPPVDGLMACWDNNSNSAGYMNLKGEWVITPQFKWAYSFKNGFADVKRADGWGLINIQGKEVVKCRWKNTINRRYGSTDFLWVTDESGDNAGYMLLKIDTDQVISKDKYQWIRVFGSDFEDVAIVGSDKDHLGIINKEGKLIIPTIFNYNRAGLAYNYMIQLGKSTWEKIDTYHFELYNNPKRNDSRLGDTIDSTLWDY